MRRLLRSRARHWHAVDLRRVRQLRPRRRPDEEGNAHEAGGQHGKAGQFDPDHGGNPMKVPAITAPAIITSSAHQKADIGSNLPGDRTPTMPTTR